MVNLSLFLARVSRVAATLALCASVLCLFVLAAPRLRAQAPSSSVSGKVVDPTGEPISGITVTLTNLASAQKIQARTDARGEFTLSSPPLGPATIIISGSHWLPSGPINRTIDGSNLVLNPVKLNMAPPQMVGATAHETGGGFSESYVAVSTNAVAGPMGYAASPSLDGATQSLSAQQQALVAGQQFNYPSIIFYISAAPLVNLPSSDQLKNSDVAQETDRNPIWLDASFALSFYDKDGNTLGNACSDGSVQVLGLMPQQTVAALKNSTIADVASAANDVAGALSTFYPGTSAQVGAATKAMNIVFQDIFPPKPVAYEYSNMTDNCNFGWYFRPNTSANAGAAGQASILGIQTGIALLKTQKSIASIKVTGRSLSAWNNPPTSNKQSKLFLVDDRPIGTISLPSTENIDYDNITSLTMFPALIPQAEARKILHLAPSADFAKFATAHNLVGTDENFDYVTNPSLNTFLGLAAPAPQTSTNATPAPSTKAQDKSASTKSTSADESAQKGSTTPAKPSTPTDPASAKPGKPSNPSTKTTNKSTKPDPAKPQA
jgi:hypothetical protein